MLLLLEIITEVGTFSSEILDNFLEPQVKALKTHLSSLSTQASW